MFVSVDFLCDVKLEYVRYLCVNYFIEKYNSIIILTSDIL